MVNLNELQNEDQILITLVLKKNRKAENELYEKYKKIICSYIKKKYNKNIDVEDDVAEILIKVFYNIEKYDSCISTFKTWVFNICKNHLIDKYRKNKNNIIISENDKNCTDIKNNSLSPDQHDLTYENNDYVKFVSENIDESDFKLLNMKYGEGYSYAEIGSEYNYTSNTISNKVNYIKLKIKNKIKKLK